ncbi:GyrI-like domain-containing protein [Paenibacillus ginsengarvi]|uniref:AraC family transcriptional regulator n=1 Tax=Paenibacillus ginsengarvi TaxID=400777 RepID=A0A3B0BCE9_9BACL|nr:GyrI-like domain-containing protein [Paenibacillus ginsengarvi]RKN70061.1 AraC family transcriptional regulator [Paenibacillus ginsengarvi]
MNIIQLGAKKLIGIRVLCEGDQYVHEIPMAAEAVKMRLPEIRNKVHPQQFIGAFVVAEYPEEQDGYWIGVEVENTQHIPAGMTSLEIPAQTYAVITHEGPNTGIRRTYEILHEWIAAQGHERILSAWHLELSGIGGGPVELHSTIRA